VRTIVILYVVLCCIPVYDDDMVQYDEWAGPHLCCALRLFMALI
jgi:hypothetical protein